MSYGAAPIAAVIPVFSAVAAGSTAPSSDPWSYMLQLGVGGVLVAFAVWLQDRFATAKKAEVEAERVRSDAATAALIAEKDARIASLEARISRETP